MILENGYLLNHRYRIVDILGMGGMGAVYRAVDENLDITVAIKENTFQSKEYARQFHREAQVLATLRHPNLPRVFDYFIIDQQGQYLVMDYIEGEDLRQWLSRDEILPEIEVIQIGIAICNALRYLHSQDPPILHRDIKPGNIKITPNGDVVLVDFGLVKVMHEREITTSAARAMTPGYSPPEQYGEASTDHRSDIYSLGATLYAALTGYLPEDSLAQATGKTSLTPIRNRNPEVSKHLAVAVERALKIKLEERWQSASEFKSALLKARESIPQEVRSSYRLKEEGQRSQKISQDIQPKNLPRTGFGKVWHILRRNLSKPDPVWVVFGTTLALLVLIFMMIILVPEGLQNLFAQAAINSPTTTKLISEQTVSNTKMPNQENSWPTSTPGATEIPANFELDHTPIPSPTSLGGGAGSLAFVSERSGLPQIWLFDVSSRKTVQLTTLPDGACQPDWSPDGTQIIFTSPCSGKRSNYPGSSLFLINLDDGELHPLPASLEGDFDPAWSPLGEEIAYTSIINGQNQLMKMDLGNQTVIKLSDGNYDDSNPAWSPNGFKIAFTRIRSVGQIWIMDADGNNPHQFTLSGKIDNSKPDWHQSGEFILFSQVLGLGSPSKQLIGMRLEDAGEHEEYPIAPSKQSEYIPLMDNVDSSPDGYWLAFDYWYFNVLSDIYIMSFPGSNLIQLTEDPNPDYDPVWRPHSNH